MEDLQYQEQLQYKEKQDSKKYKPNKNKRKCSVTIHNPNSPEETAKYLAKLIIQELEQKDSEK